MKKYKLINSSTFKGGNIVPLYQVFDTETREIFYEAINYKRNARGKTTANTRFAHAHKSKVTQWRESVGQA